MPGSVLRSHATHSLSNSRTTDGLKSVSVSKPSSSPSSAITRSLRLCATYDETAASDPAVGATEQTIALPLGPCTQPARVGAWRYTALITENATSSTGAQSM